MFKVHLYHYNSYSNLPWDALIKKKRSLETAYYFRICLRFIPSSNTNDLYSFNYCFTVAYIGLDCCRSFKHWKIHSIRMRVWPVSRFPFSFYYTILFAGNYFFNFWCRTISYVPCGIYSPAFWLNFYLYAFSGSSLDTGRHYSWEKRRVYSMDKLLVK